MVVLKGEKRSQTKTSFMSSVLAIGGRVRGSGDGSPDAASPDLAPRAPADDDAQGVRCSNIVPAAEAEAPADTITADEMPKLPTNILGNVPKPLHARHV
eukprot:15449469-Alexandrium_andersonii.AAC.1